MELWRMLVQGKHSKGVERAWRPKELKQRPLCNKCQLIIQRISWASWILGLAGLAEYCEVRMAQFYQVSFTFYFSLKNLAFFFCELPSNISKLIKGTFNPHLTQTPNQTFKNNKSIYEQKQAKMVKKHQQSQKAFFSLGKSQVSFY